MSFELKPLEKKDWPLFIQLNQKAFKKGYEEYFGKCKETVIPDADILSSLREKGAHAYMAFDGSNIVGGVDVTIDETTQENHLDLLFVNGVQDRGIGYEIWIKIEALFPQTKVWRTCTPYFDRRNIHFYVNKCHFHIVEFYNCYHPDPSCNTDFRGDAGEGMFEFEKKMVNESHNAIGG